MLKNIFSFKSVIALAFLSAMILNANAQISSTQVTFPAELKKTNIQILFSDGLGNTDTIPFINNRINIKKPFYGRYAEVEITIDEDHDSNQSFIFYVDEQPTKIVFVQKNGKVEIDKMSSKNYLNPDQLGKQTFESKTDSLNKKVHLLNEKQLKSPNDRDNLEELISVYTDVQNIRYEFIKTHLTSYFAFQTLKRTSPTDKYNADSLVKLFKQFPTSFINTKEGNELQELFNGWSLKKGMDAPHFTINDIHGNEIDLNAYRGRYVLLNFWATWCVPCMAEMPAIVEIEKSTKNDKLELIFLSNDEDPKAMNQAIENQQMKGVQIVSNDQTIRKFGAQAIPRLFLIDPYGKIIYERESDELDKENLSSLRSMVKNLNL